MKSGLSLLVVILTMLIAAPAMALDLQSARSGGLVGEKLDGYVAAVQSTSEVEALVADVNSKRHDEYARISKQNGQTADVVAKLAAEQIINKLPAGSLYQAPNGGWTKK